MAINPATTPHFTVGSTVTYSIATTNYSNRFQFDYRIDGDTLKFDYQGAIRAAFNTWAESANLTFQNVSDGASVDIRFGFEAIDGRGNTIGMDRNILIGNLIDWADISFDVAEPWTYKTFQSVALHEIGHALGLGHEDSVPSIMSTYTQNYPTDLTPEDIWNIQTLYPVTSAASSGIVSSIDPYRNAAITSGGVSTEVTMDPYSGPVAYLANMHIGTDQGEAVRGSIRADFLNARGGDDAVDGGAGTDVLDGGLGSNFLSGGADSDTFFVDGRSGGTTWSTVTDLEKGELVTAWGWKEGVSKLTWQEMTGARGYKGATAHMDLDGNGSIDMSLTIAGRFSSAVVTLPGQVEGNSYIAFALT